MKIVVPIICISFLLAFFQAGAQITIIRGPYLQTATSSSSIILRWRTSTATPSRVLYGLSVTSLNLSKEDPAITTEHIVKLSNLRARTKYYYAIADFSSVLDKDTANHFYTLPVPGSTGTYRIGVFGDCGNNSVNQRNVRDAFLKYIGGNNLDSWLLLGDNAYDNGTDPQYQSGFFNVYRRSLLRTSPLWPSPGNHEYNNLAAKQLDKDIAYFSAFSVPENGEAGGVASRSKSYYSFDIGNVHLISLDSYGIDSNTRLSDTTGLQARWLKADLSASQHKEWVIVFFHHPPYTMGSHNSDTEPELINLRKNLLPVLERYGVDVVLTGHSHVYERSGLLKGYFGSQKDFSNSYLLSTSTGLYNGTANSCTYIKNAANNGTVYVVSGSAGQLGGQQPGFPLPNMKFSNTGTGGAVIMEVTGNRLDLKWINTDNQVRDQFTMMKGVNKSVTHLIEEGDTLRLTASFNATYNWNLVPSRARSIVISPVVGNYSFIVKDNPGCLNDTFLVEVRPNTDSAIIRVDARFLNKKAVLVSWQYPAAEEADIHHYTIERSVNNIVFNTVGSVPRSATGSGTFSSYSFTDTTNIIVRKLYYRIKSVSLTGIIRYSAPVVTDFNGLDLDENIIIAPNPARSGDFRIRFKGGIGQAAIDVFDMMGRKIYATSLLLNASFKPLLPLSLPAGMYTVLITIDDDFVVKRILVL